jgi:hypothetical protein
MSINVANPKTNPVATPFPEVFQPQPRSFYLANMAATLGQNGLRLYPLERTGDPIHRFMDGVANEIAKKDKATEDIISRAILEAGFMAEGITPRTATYATGTQLFTRTQGAATAAEVIPADTAIIGASGRSVRTILPATVAIGQSSVAVQVRAEVVGLAGNAPAGEFTSLLGSLPSPYTTNNITPIEGGTDEELLIERFSRLQAVRAAKSFGGVDYVAAQLRNMPTTGGFNVRRVAVIQPWRVPELGGDGGSFYIVIEAGGGSAPISLVTAAQAVANDAITASGACVVLSSNPHIVNATVEARFEAGINPSDGIAELRRIWATSFSGTAIEDGSGRGETNLSGILGQMQQSGVSKLRLVTPASNLVKPALGSVLVPGLLSVNPI